MRTLDRNKRTFYYCLLSDNSEAVDENGYYTGERTKTYSEPIKFNAHISAAKGKASQEAFGLNLAYDKTIITDKNCPITETSVLFIDKEPLFDEGDMPLNDYEVVSVAESLNYKMIAIKKVSDENH